MRHCRNTTDRHNVRVPAAGPTPCTVWAWQRGAWHGRGCERTEHEEHDGRQRGAEKEEGGDNAGDGEDCSPACGEIDILGDDASDDLRPSRRASAPDAPSTQSERTGRAMKDQRSKTRAKWGTHLEHECGEQRDVLLSLCEGLDVAFGRVPYGLRRRLVKHVQAHPVASEHVHKGLFEAALRRDALARPYSRAP